MADLGEGLGGEQVMALLRQLLSGDEGDTAVQEIHAASDREPFASVQEPSGSRRADSDDDLESDESGRSRPATPLRSTTATTDEPGLDYWLEELRRLPEDSPRFAQVFRRVLALLRAGRE